MSEAPVTPSAGLTRNGLRKRQPRARAGGGTAGATKVIDLDAMSEYLVTPDNGIPVTAGFAALRDGMTRGEKRRPEPAGEPGDGPAEPEDAS